MNTSTHITKTPTQLSEHPHIHTTTHYKTHTYTHTLITKPTHTHTQSLQNPHIHTHMAKQVKTTTFQDTHQIKEASKPAGNWFQLLMVLFTKEYLPNSVLRFHS